MTIETKLGIIVFAVRQKGVLMNIFNKVGKLAGRVKEKLNSYIKITEEFAGGHKQIARLSGFAAGIILCSITLLTLFTPAYEVYLNGEKVAVVVDKDDFVQSFERANEEIENLAGKGFGVARIPKYIFTVAVKSCISTSEEMIDCVMAQSDAVNKVFAISVDGEDVAFAKNEKAAQGLIEKAAAVYGGENRQILNNVEIARRYVAAYSLTDERTTIKTLASVLKVQTEKTSVYETELLFNRVENLTEDLFVNEEKVSAQGKNGLMEVTARVTKINGKVQKTDIVSSKVLEAPVNEVVMVGTTAIPAVGTGVFAQPYEGMITSRFGSRWGRTHTGTDICGEVGDAIKAADTGVVITAEYQENGYGNIIIIDHQNGVHTWYAHLDSMNVSAGDVVEKGDKIGELGNTGYSTGPHLHFEVRENGSPVNPSKYLESLQ